MLHLWLDADRKRNTRRLLDELCARAAQERKQMIRENNLNFTEIAAALQYSTVHHFSRQFKEKFGITPTEYARSVR